MKPEFRLLSDEQINQIDILYIIGGGHVSLATSKLFKELGFYTIVFDNRSNLNTLESNSYANKKEIVNYDNRVYKEEVLSNGTVA